MRPCLNLSIEEFKEILNHIQFSPSFVIQLWSLLVVCAVCTRRKMKLKIQPSWEYNKFLSSQNVKSPPEYFQPNSLCDTALLCVSHFWVDAIIYGGHGASNKNFALACSTQSFWFWVRECARGVKLAPPACPGTESDNVIWACRLAAAINPAPTGAKL